MILTGRAKEDFLKHLDVEEKWFDEEYVDLFSNALIIEWFDSVGIYIWTMPSLRVETKWTYRVFKSVLTENIKQRAFSFKTRAEATTEAIKKANEIYNSL